MKFSLVMFGYPLEHYGPTARAAESAGFEAVWLAEHLVTPTSFAHAYPYSPSGEPGYQTDTPFADIWVTIGHLAALTDTLTLGAGVCVLPLRNPFVTAKAVGTAQKLSRGRVVLGIGTGWMREEFDALGEQWHERGSRTEEIVEILGKLWTGKPDSHDGRWYSFGEVQMSPAAEPTPPIVVGGISKSALDRAARIGDGWYGPSCSLDMASVYKAEIVRRLAREGRDASLFKFYCRLNDPISPESAVRARELGIDHLVVPLHSSVQGLDQKLEHVAELGQEITKAKAAL